jgi:hypothetical protein
MKKLNLKKIAIGMLVSGFIFAGMGFGTNLFTLFNVYDRADGSDCQSGSGCKVDDATSTLPLGKGLTYFGIALMILGALLLIYILWREDKK